MKGIILAGGKGSRLYPLTEAINKQLLPVYDKPMVYYPLTTLIENGIKEICIISHKELIPLYKGLLGDGKRFGIELRYLEQKAPRGIPEAFIIAQRFIGGDNVTLILGDNIFYGSGSVFARAFKKFEKGATIFAYEVEDPSSYGVIEFNAKTKKAISLEEKPTSPKSNYAIPGLYIYDNSVIELSKGLKPSPRGELEITDVNRHYANYDLLNVYKTNRGCAWLDAGSCNTLYESASYVQVIEKRQGIKIGCPEEAALIKKFITKKDLQNIIENTPESEYKKYLKKLCTNH